MSKIIKMLFIMITVIIINPHMVWANSDKVTIPEGADLTSIRRMAIGAPLYLQVRNTAPSIELLTQVIYDASRVIDLNTLSYDYIVDAIKTDENIDIKALERREAAKIFKENIASYADTYIVLTVANNSRTTFFFDVFKSGTNELLYTYEIRANKSEEDSVMLFNALSEKFYKRLFRSIEEQNRRNKN